MSYVHFRSATSSTRPLPLKCGTYLGTYDFLTAYAKFATCPRCIEKLEAERPTLLARISTLRRTLEAKRYIRERRL